MAVLKEQISERGIVTNYHRVSSVTIAENSLTFILCSYPSEFYRQTSLPAIMKEFHFEITLEEEESTGARKLCYIKLKTLDEWIGSEDC